MENKKELISLNSKLYSSLSLEELEERTELGCWTYCMVNWITCGGDYTPCTSYTCQGLTCVSDTGGECSSDIIGTCDDGSSGCVYNFSCPEYFPAPE